MTNFNAQGETHLLSSPCIASISNLLPLQIAHKPTFQQGLHQMCTYPNILPNKPTKCQAFHWEKADLELICTLCRNCRLCPQMQTLKLQQLCNLGQNTPEWQPP